MWRSLCRVRTYLGWAGGGWVQRSLVRLARCGRWRGHGGTGAASQPAAAHLEPAQAAAAAESREAHAEEEQTALPKMKF